MGAAQWANGYWVAASTLAYPEPLRFFLNHQARSIGRKDLNMLNYRLLKYFESGSPLNP